VSKASPEQNKKIVLQAFDALFNRRDYAAAAGFWSESYIQHSAHIEPGRDGLFNLIKSLPHTLRYENSLIMAEGDYVILHGRFSGNGTPGALIAGYRQDGARSPRRALGCPAKRSDASRI
jgi:predicted SnoaL-like aldol condensation-catalyzing enzyme